MQVLKAALATAVLLSMTLAGCSGSGGGGSGFSVKESGGEYTFTAAGSADNYTWDLGDHLTRAYTKSVKHTYDFENGILLVRLVTMKGGVRAEATKELTLGTGVNENAGFVLEGSSNWTVVGQTITFSAHRSTDPDGDALRYTWSCQRTGDAIRKGFHSHPGFGGKPFATPPAGSVFSVNAQGPLPAADRTIPGDLCEGLGTSGRPSLDATITGAFTKGGDYDIYLLASDPVHPTTSGKYRVIVTPAAEKPAEIQVMPFQGTFQAGAGGTVQDLCEPVEEQCTQSFDETQHSFSTPLPAQAGWMELAYDNPTTQMVITCNLERGTTPVATVEGAMNVTLDPKNLPNGSYQVTCSPNAVIPTDPAGVAYTLTVGIDLNIDPFLLY
jgi:hypothetical protein